MQDMHTYHFQSLFAFIYVNSLQCGLPLLFSYPSKIPSLNMTQKYLNSPLVTISQCTCPVTRLCGLLHVAVNAPSNLGEPPLSGTAERTLSIKEQPETALRTDIALH